LREFEEPPCLFQSLSGLDCHGAVHAGSRKFDGQIRGKKIAAKDSHAVVDPTVFDRRVMP
jgi:hypothetical protein